MIHPIHPNQAQFVPAPPASFNEGVGAVARSIGAIALTAISAFVSLVFLPWEGAFAVSAVVAGLAGMWCCRSEQPRGDVVMQDRWYQPLINAMPGFIRHMGQPVLNQGPRVEVSGQPAVFVAAPQPLMAQQAAPQVVIGGQPHFNAQPADGNFPRPLAHPPRFAAPAPQPLMAQHDHPHRLLGGPPPAHHAPIDLLPGGQPHFNVQPADVNFPRPMAQQAAPARDVVIAPAGQPIVHQQGPHVPVNGVAVLPGAGGFAAAPAGRNAQPAVGVQPQEHGRPNLAMHALAPHREAAPIAALNAYGHPNGNRANQQAHVPVGP